MISIPTLAVPPSDGMTGFAASGVRVRQETGTHGSSRSRHQLSEGATSGQGGASSITGRFPVKTRR